MLSFVLFLLLAVFRVDGVPNIIPIGVILPYNMPNSTCSDGSSCFDQSAEAPFALEVYAAFMMAIDQINRGVSVPNVASSRLPNPSQWQIKVYNNSDGVIQSNALLQTLQEINTNKVVAIVGSDYSSISEVVGLVSGIYSVPQISGSSTTVALANKATYPSFMRLIASDALQGAVVAKIVLDLGWRNMAILYCQDAAYTNGLAQDIQTSAINLNITVLAAKSYLCTTGTTADVTQQLKAIQNSGALVISLVGYATDVAHNIYKAYQLGMTGPSSGYTYLGVDAWITDPGFLNTLNGLATPVVVKSIVIGILGQGANAGYGTPIYNSFSSNFSNSALANTIWNQYGLGGMMASYSNGVATPASPQVAVNNAGFTPIYYDIGYFIGIALQNVISMGMDPSDPTLASSIAPALLNQMLNNCSFTGVSGQIVLDPTTGDRASQPFQVYNYQGIVAGTDPTPLALATPFQTTFPGQQVVWNSGSNSIPKDILPAPCLSTDYILQEVLSCSSSIPSLMNDFDTSQVASGSFALQRYFRYFLANPSYTCTATTTSGYIKPDDFTLPCDFLPSFGGGGITLIAVSVILAALNLGMGLSFLLFQNKRIMKVGLPMSMFVFALGATLLCLSNLIDVGPNTEILCMTRPIFFNLSLTLMISALLVKVYRLWRILDNKKLASRKFTSCTLFLEMFYVVSLDIVIHGVRIATSTPFSSISNAPLTGFPYTVTHQLCTSTGDKWLTASAILKVIILLVAMALTFQVSRLMTNDKLGDAKPLMFSAYNFSIFGAVYTIMSQNISGGNGVAGAYLLISVAATISVLFVAIPKYMIIWKQGDVSAADVQVSMAVSRNSGASGGISTTVSHTSTTSLDNADVNASGGEE